MRQKRFQPAGKIHPGKRTHHEHITMGEVDETQHAIDHRVAQSDQCVDRAEGKAVDELLQKFVHRLLYRQTQPKAQARAQQFRRT